MVKTRVAPSPTGYPHVGTAYQAIFDYVWAKKNNGQFVLRLEDTDAKRFVAGAEDIIYQSLAWLSLSPDESPIKPGKLAPYRQSERLAIYQKYARELVAKGSAYYCFCTTERLALIREEQKKQKLPPRYDRHCRALTSSEVESRLKNGEKAVVRMKIPDNKTVTVNDVLRGPITFDSHQLDDQVLLKSDGYPTYHLAVVVDDHLWEITHVFRGDEWLPSAPKHALLYQMFGWTEPVWIHLPLLKNPGGSKISKRQGHTSIFWYRDEGILPEAVVNFLALLDWTPPNGKEVFSLSEMINLFRLEDLRKTAAIFDLQKLYWLNGLYLRQRSDNDLYESLLKFARETNNRLLLERLEGQRELVLKTLPLIKERIKTLKDYTAWTDFFFTKEMEYNRDDFLNLLTFPKAAWEKLLAKLNNLTEAAWDEAHLEGEVRALIAQSKIDAKDLLMVLRLAITGKRISPPLWESMVVLGKEYSLRRLSKIKTMVGSKTKCTT